jgi:hypothetical protein
MPISGEALVIAIALTLAVWGGAAGVRGAKKAAHAVAHKLHHAKAAPPIR